ncbi:hypothetical protein [Actinoplanes sp. GCM10030250]|uniref:hypothetical protein n=1 Tax=Actinoplanes sp. GCM10030250 TaxID=3273376 RepID=UPI0036231A1A
MTTRRKLTAEPVEFRWGGGSTARRPRHVPMVIREPEAVWLEVEPRSSVTVAAVREGDADWHPERVMRRLAELAAGEALLVVLGSDDRPVGDAVVAELRRCLPLREVVAVPVRHRHGQLLRDAATVEGLLDAGRLPVVVTPAGTMLDVTAEIASYLRADRVLRVLDTTEGAGLCQVWRRPEPSVN